MSNPHLAAALLAMEALEGSEREQAENTFRDNYQNALDIEGSDYAEALAVSETGYWLARIDVDPDGYAYLRSQIFAR